jgi:hypothetical protein
MSAWRWSSSIPSGTNCSLLSRPGELAAAEEINASYVGRVLRLTLLAPDIVKAILDGTQPASLALGSLLHPFPVDWRKQLELVARDVS